jgi:hypothetical protein
MSYLEMLEGEQQRAEQKWRELHRGEAMNRLFHKFVFGFICFILGAAAVLACIVFGIVTL